MQNSNPRTDIISRLVRLASPAIILTLALLSFPLGHSAVIPKETEALPLWFVNFLDNRITFRPSGFSVKKFEKQVEKAHAGEEPLKILHIGDSHVQADIFTAETRRLFAQWLTDTKSGRGFTFPYQLAGTNNPFDFEVTTNTSWRRERIVDIDAPAKLGVSGIAVITSDSTGLLTFKLKKPWSINDSFDMVKVYYDSDSLEMQFSTESKGLEINHSDGLWVYNLDNPTDTFTLEFRQKENNGKGFRLYGIELLNTHTKILYHAVGVNGAEVRTFLLSQNMEKLLSQIDPHLVLLSLGTNDAYNSAFNADRFHENLTELICRIRSVNPEIMIILTTPGDHLVLKQNENPSLELIQNEIYRVANEWGCGVWDFYHIMGGPGSIRLWSHHGLCAPDLLHLNRNGYRLQGALLFNALVDLSGYEPSTGIFQELANQ